MKTTAPLPARILVHVKADIQDLIPLFLENRRKDIRRLGECLERSDFKATYIIGHNLAGTGSAYGFNLLTEIGRKMELASKAENAADVRALTAEIDAYLNTVEVIYE